MKIPRILLMGGTFRDNCVGELFFKELCRHLPPGHLARFAFPADWAVAKDRPDEWMGFPLLKQPRMRVDSVLRFGSTVSAATSYSLHAYQRQVYAPYLARKGAAFGKKHGVNLLWAALDNPLVIYTADRIAKLLKIPMVVTVWDPPETFAVWHNHDKVTLRNLLYEFDKNMLMAVRHGVASENMADAYGEKYGISPFVQIHGPSRNQWLQPRETPLDPSVFRIGFAGSIYADNTWAALMEALHRCDWTLAGRKVVIRIASANLRWNTQRKVNIEYRGFHPFPKVLHELNECDVCYAPYWFEKEFTYSVRYCFPNKIATYLAAGTPVIYHGPENSSPTRFFKRFPIGVRCHSQEPEKIIEDLTPLAGDMQVRARAIEGGKQALDEEINEDIFRSRFEKLLGLQPGDLIGGKS